MKIGAAILVNGRAILLLPPQSIILHIPQLFVNSLSIGETIRVYSRDNSPASTPILANFISGCTLEACLVQLGQHEAQLNQASNRTMCYGSQRLSSLEDAVEIRVAENLRGRIAETEARLEQARVSEADLSRCLDEMKKFANVMEILETYLRRRYKEQHDHLEQLYSSPPSILGINYGNSTKGS